ncbi:uncharacterized protein MONBRDRAFT_14089, partial [Monosiga brevicollis MX1]
RFRGVAAQYEKKVVESEARKQAISDLQSFHRALDRAITKYHDLKMDEINKIIKELWQNTYRGHDIDYIEIDTNWGDETSTTSKRNAVNYRVVMIKGDTRLDMRNRCSAGQRVMASLIIRLALAEAFCINCGVMTLDEPTTNLDRENINSLAFCLSNIVKHRSQQRNFQLLIITHDEQFLEQLHQYGQAKTYYRVFKSPEYVLVR